MLGDLHEVSQSFGLAIHPDKTKILTNATKKSGRGKAHTVDVHGMSVNILPIDGAVKYLGLKFSFYEYQGTELKNRIRAGWAKFMLNKQELTSKSYSLNDRLRLFDAVVSPTVLYAAGAWNLTKDQERLLQKTQRKMLRMILGHGRRRQPVSQDSLSDSCDVDSDVEVIAEEQEGSISDTEGLEPWGDWIRRVTHYIEAVANKLDMKSWVMRARGQKWDLAGKACRNNPARWTHRLINWDPSLDFDGLICRARRIRAHPKLRWADDLSRYMAACHGSNDWRHMAKLCGTWEANRQEFCDGTWRTNQT